MSFRNLCDQLVIFTRTTLCKISSLRRQFFPFCIRHGICIIRLISLNRFSRLHAAQSRKMLDKKQHNLSTIGVQYFTCACSGRTETVLMKTVKFIRNLMHYRLVDNIFSKILVFIFLLSMLWTSTNCLHGSVKLSTNTIKTKYGQIRGIVLRTNPVVEAYLGIPYASPPVGSLRFMPPITPSTWKNVRNADRFSPVCPQVVPIPPNGPEALLEVPRARLAQLRRLLPLLNNQSEDCLYLNIYVPYANRNRNRRFATNNAERNETTELSTIVYIHGESYEWSSGNPYDGSELAAHGNVIVVTINFRLGIFGFLKTGGKESAQGNFGLMDLVAGLHWLKENLPAFGGDPNSISLFGHGTGAVLANILVVSPVASDLIQRVVLVSGSALSPWAIQKNPLFVKRRVAEQTGCHGDMMFDDLAPCLRTKTVSELLAVTIDFPRFLMGFAPFVDGTVIAQGTDSIGTITLPLGSAIVSTSGIEFANFPKRDLLFCLTSVESYLDLSAQDLEFGFNETRRDRILRTFVRNNYHYHLNEIFAVLKNEYTDWEKAVRNPLSSRDATLSFLSDGHTASALIKLGYLHSLRGGRSYFLHFRHKTVQEEFPQRTGSVRGEDVPFWLGLPISPLFPYNYTTQEKKISRLMLRYLANFVKTGNPNQSTLSSSSFPLTSTSVVPNNINSNVLSRDVNKRFSNSYSNYNYNIQERIKRLSDVSNNTQSHSSIKGSPIAEVKVNNPLNLEVIYNQRRSNAMREKRTNRHHLKTDDVLTENHNDANLIADMDGSHLPYWDAYDVVNQLYMELGTKAEIQSHYRGHKLSMWLSLIPQLHRHSNINDQSMRHHQFLDDINNRDLYEGVVRPQLQTKPTDDEDIHVTKTNVPIKSMPNNISYNNRSQSTISTTECGIDGALFVSEQTTQIPTLNRSSFSPNKDIATASTGIIGNLEVLRRLSSKQFQSYTTALIATVAVGCFLLILNVLIFAGIYYQREKRARDAKTKEELQDSNSSKTANLLKLNVFGSEGSGSFVGISDSGKAQVVFGEYNCYDEKTKQDKDNSIANDMSTPKTCLKLDTNWSAACSTNTLDLLKTKTCNPLEVNYVVTAEHDNDIHVHTLNSIEMGSYNQLPMSAVLEPSGGKQITHFDYAVQSSDKMSFTEIEQAVKVTPVTKDDITQDDDIPEPPPPPKIYHSSHQQQHNSILRQSGGSVTQSSTTGNKKRVHIQEISV